MQLMSYESTCDFEPVKLRYALENGDALEVLTGMENESIGLVITSPPYNIGKSYEVKTSIESYLQTQENIIAELIRVLSPNGSICWEVGNYVDKGEISPLDVFYYQIFKNYGLQLRNRIAWQFGHWLDASNRFSRRQETTLYY